MKNWKIELEDDELDWNELGDDFWDELSNDMNEYGYNKKKKEFYWIEMSYYRTPEKTNHFEFFENE